ncbi:MAG: hypothetical protein M3Q97_08140, partial [Bacteroidota bacterium]|nr:hypothetical protein [Bacteroidota bacterium]
MQLYPDNIYQKLEYQKIIQVLEELCFSALGSRHVKKLTPSSDYEKVKNLLAQVAEMKELKDRGAILPSENYHDLGDLLTYFELDNSVLTEEQFREIIEFLQTIRAIFSLLEKQEEHFPALHRLLKYSKFEQSLLRLLQNIITEEGRIRPGVSPALDKVRKEVKDKERELERKFQSLLQWGNERAILSAEGETIRNGRRVLSVLSEHKRMVKGIVHDESATGKTTFIEPEATVEISNGIIELHGIERREVYKILKDLTDKLRPAAPIIHSYQSLAGIIDFIQAKAHMAFIMRAHSVSLIPEAEI